MFRIYQLKIDSKGKRALFDLNPFFYPPKAIERAAGAFRGICSVKSMQKGSRLMLELIVPKKLNAEETALNFLNYALSIRREMC